MSGAAKPIEDVVVNSADGAREQAVRDLLIKYQRALALVERLAIALLDSVQPDAEPMAPEQARERRHTVAEAMTMVATETPHGEQLWRELVLERRLSHPEAPLPLAVRVDRRRKSPRRAASRPKL
jgi:hypothetical protein